MTLRRSQDSFTQRLAGRLTGMQSQLHAVIALAILLITANTVFLLVRRAGLGCAIGGEERCTISEFYQLMVLSHSGIGILMATAIVVFLMWHLAGQWTLARRRWKSLVSGLGLPTLTLFLLGSGLYFMLEAKTSSVMWLYYSHVGAAALFLAVYVAHRLFAHGTGRAIWREFSVALAAVFAVLVALEIAFAPPQPTPILTANLQEEDADYAAPSTVPPTHKFFPSPVQLASGAGATTSEMVIGNMPQNPEVIRAEVAEQGFATSTLIGAEKCSRCHQEITRQWSMSAHRFSSFNNPYYVATLEFLRGTVLEPTPALQSHMIDMGLPPDRVGKVKSKWCAGCHDPALLLAGKMTSEVDLGSVAAQAGITCLSCHLIEDIPNHTGNGNFVWNDTFTDSYLFSKASGGLKGKLHDLYLSANPERHRADMIKPLYRTSEFCATCHKVSLDQPVNNYRWLRGQNEYDAWHSSGVAHNAARTFYLPPQAHLCQDCHMAPIEAQLPDAAADGGKVFDHTFGAANTALPTLRNDGEAIREIEAYLQNKRLRLHFAAAGTRHAPQVLTPEAPLQINSTEVALEMHLVVRNLSVGHSFPGGTNDSNESWVEIRVTDATGRLIAAAGQIDPDQEVARDTRFYQVVMVDKHGKPIDKRNAQDAVAAAYARTIGPGTADVVRFALPPKALADAAFPLSVTAELKWRKFTQVYNRFAFEANPEGFAHFDAPPVLPVTTMASAHMLVERGEAGLVLHLNGPQPPEDIGQHDYAIGLLLQGDTQGAALAAANAVATNAKCFNCRRTQIKVMMREGQFTNARAALTALEADEPRNPQNAWLWAQLLVREGRFASAEKALNFVLATFTGDREAMKLKSRAAYLDGRPDAALAAAEAALDVDPEDSTANYYAMLAAQSLVDPDKANTFEAAFRYHKEDEAAQQATLEYRQSEEDVNFASQPIQVFELQKVK